MMRLGKQFLFYFVCISDVRIRILIRIRIWIQDYLRWIQIQIQTPKKLNPDSDPDSRK